MSSAAKRAVTVLMAALMLASVADCTHQTASGGRPATVTVTPTVSPLDQGVHFRVAGLVPNTQVQIGVTSTDAAGVTWRSSATFRSDATGTVNPDRTPATSGSYTGVDGMGLIWSMSTTIAAGATKDYRWTVGTMRFAVIVTLHGRQVAATTFARELAPAYGSITLPDAAGAAFIGAFFAGARAAPVRHTAVLEIGGSEGGLADPYLARLLAGHGFPTLALAYFRYVGRPKVLSRIPIDYFARAARWLHRQADVRRVVVIGVSRGSEAAQLLAAHFPRLIQGVVAAVPNDSALCAFPRCLGPAWTLHGRPLPFTSQFDNPSPTDHPDAVIPVERIRGPMFLVCGGADETWTSCPYARAIARRLVRHHSRWPHSVFAYPHAGHYVGFMYPYEPRAGSDHSAAADQKARADVWPRLLRFLASV